MTENPTPTTETEAPSELERRFRRLLRAYPRWYRRHRGEELLGTLLDASADDQERPTPTQRRDILRSGLKSRLRVRGRAGGVAVAVVLALVGAVLGSWVGAWLSWLGAPDLPDERETTAIAAEAFDGVEPPEIYGDASLFAYDVEFYGEPDDPFWLVALFGGDDYGSSQRVAELGDELSEEQWKTVMPRVADNLERTGWHVTEASLKDGYASDPDAQYVELTAFRDGHVITVDGFSDPVAATMRISRAHPPGFEAGWIAGAVAGLLAGWLLAVRIAWQVTVVHPTRSGVVLPLLFVAAIFGFLPLLAGTALTIMILSGAQSEPGSPPWWPVMSFPYRPLCLLSMMLAAVAVACAMAPRRNRVRARYSRQNVPIR